MTWWQRLWHRNRMEHELDAELRYHFDRCVEDNVRAGMSEAEARREARLEFGGEDQLKEVCRDARRTGWIENLAQDAKFSVRLLLRERWFSTTAVLALALGIAATSAIVAIINGYYFRGLPVEDPDRILHVATRDRTGRERGVSFVDYNEWRAARSFEALGAFTGGVMTIRDSDMSPDSVGGMYVSADTFQILGEIPILGRAFSSEDDQPGAPGVVILGYRLWWTRYAGDPAILGRVVTIDARPAVVVGVMREGFEFPFRHALWQPLGRLPGIEAQTRDERVLSVFGRLAETASPAQARGELAAIAAGLATAQPGTDDGIEPVVDRFGLQQVGRLQATQPPVILLMTALFVLLVACANVACLLLARSAGRARELAIRASVGATRWRIVRQQLVEGLLLSFLAGALGLGISRFGVAFVADAFGRNTPYWMHFPLDAQVLAVVLGLCLTATLAFGLAPALLASRVSFNELMKEGGRTGVAPRVSRWIQGLLIAELSVTVVLLAGAGLLVRSFLVVYYADQVIDPSQVLTMEIALPEGKYDQPAVRSEFYRRLDDRLGRATGLTATVASDRPFSGAPSQHVSFLDRPKSVGERRPPAAVIPIRPRYFDTLRAPALRGQYFASNASATQAAVVNQRFADLFYANENPIGRLIRLSDNDTEVTEGPWLTIVGVSPTIRQSVAAGTRPAVYLPIGSHVAARAAIIVGHLSDMNGVAPRIRREVAAVDPDVTLFNVRPLNELRDDSRLQPRVVGTLIATFAGTALFLSMVGLYAVTAYAVRQRTHEIGVRLSLGALPSEVVWLFVRRGMRPMAIGLMFGLVGAYGVGQLLQGILIQTSSTDPVTIAFIVTLVIAVSIAACFFPARRASTVDPLTVLRSD